MNRTTNSSEQNLPLVSVVIPTHNRKEKLARLIESILQSDYPKDRLEIIVVDDASTDGTYEYIRKNFPEVKIIRNREEKLVAESRNIGIRASRGKYVFIIDDDNIIDKVTIRKLVEYMEKHPDIGVAGPIMYFLSDPKRIWCAGVKRSYWTTITKLIGFNTIDQGQYKEPLESEDLPNAFMVRKEVFEKVGLFSSSLFPIHYEEAEFCERVRRLGYRIIVLPSAKVWHDISLEDTSFLHLKNYMRAYYALRNRILYHAICSRTVFQMILAILCSVFIIAPFYTLKVATSKNKMKAAIILALFKGLADGMKIIGIARRFNTLFRREILVRG